MRFELFHMFCFIIIHLLNLIWLYWIVMKSYFIILPRMKLLFVMFLFHLVCHFSSSVLFLLRGAWNPDTSSFIFENDFLCHVYGRLLCATHIFMLISPTLFGYYKTKIYAQVLDNSWLRNTMAALKVLIAMWLLSLILNILLMDSGPFLFEGVKMCFKYPPAWIANSNAALWIIVNGFTTCFSIRYYPSSEGNHDQASVIKEQMRWNMFVIPPMFFITFFSRVIGLWYADAHVEDKQLRLFFMTMPPAFCELVNSVVMHRFLFKFSGQNWSKIIDSHGSEDGWKRSESRSRSPCSSDQWVGFYGAHPVRLDYAYIRDHNLESLIIPEHLWRRQVYLTNWRRRYFPTPSTQSIEVEEEISRSFGDEGGEVVIVKDFDTGVKTQKRLLDLSCASAQNSDSCFSETIPTIPSKIYQQYSSSNTLDLANYEKVHESVEKMHEWSEEESQKRMMELYVKALHNSESRISDTLSFQLFKQYSSSFLVESQEPDPIEANIECQKNFLNVLQAMKEDGVIDIVPPQNSSSSTLRIDNVPPRNSSSSPLNISNATERQMQESRTLEFSTLVE